MEDLHGFHGDLSWPKGVRGAPFRMPSRGQVNVDFVGQGQGCVSFIQQPSITVIRGVSRECPRRKQFP